ncbi:MAG: hypothetical protein ACJ8KU_03835 [Chthoniobacterales bacterium]
MCIGINYAADLALIPSNCTTRIVSLFAMKLQDPAQFESERQQERRARQRVRPKALFYSALIAGAIVFVLPAGPWMSHESMFAAMGRAMIPNAIADLAIHLVMAFVYGWLIALCIYSLPLAGGLMLGPVLGLALYGLNYLVFGAVGRMQSNELHVAIAHFLFGLFFAVAYRAMAVPPPRRVA